MEGFLIAIIVTLHAVLIGSYPVEFNTGNASQDCAELIGDCRFYHCLAKAHGCPAFTMEPFGQQLCHHLREHEHQFSHEGQIWLRETLTCHSSKMLAIQLPSSGKFCRKLFEISRKQMPVCAYKHGICDILSSEKEVFMQSCRRGHWMDIVELSQKCPREMVDDFVHWLLFHM